MFIPTWTPEQIKAVMMNQAETAMKNADKTAPAPATAMGAGRVQAVESATADRDDLVDTCPCAPACP